jgi:trk system potassium uptake protein TrkH
MSIPTSPEFPLSDPLTGDTWFRWLIPAWFGVAAIGAILLATVGSAAGNEMPPDKALFTAFNAITLTGFAGAGAENLVTAGHVVVLLLTLFGTFAALVAGAGLASRVLGVELSSRRIVKGALFLLAVAIFGAMMIAPRAGILWGLQLGIGALGNSGMAWMSPPPIQTWPVQLVLLPLAIAGGLGIPILLAVYDWLIRRLAIPRLVMVSLQVTSGLYLVGTLGLVAILYVVLHGMNATVGAAGWVSASTASIDARSLGMGFEPLSIWPRIVPWLLMPLMLIGVCPGGTGGGLLTMTPAIILSKLPRILRGQIAGRWFGVALIWTMVYCGVIAIVTALLVATAPQIAGDRLLFLAISAVGTVGLSHEPVSLVGPPLHILTLAMIFGRIAPLAMLWWMGRGENGDD